MGGPTSDVSREDLLAIHDTIAHQVKGSTEAGLGISKVASLWSGYARLKGFGANAFLKGMSRDRAVHVLLAFLLRCRRQGLGLSRIKRSLHQVFLRGLGNPAHLEDARIAAYVKGARFQGVHLKTVVKARFARRKVPLPFSWIPRSRVRFFRLPSKIDEEVQASMAYLILVLQVHTAERISNFARTQPVNSSRKSATISDQGPDTHALRGADAIIFSNDRLPSAGPQGRDRGRDTALASHEWLGTAPVDNVFALCLLFYTRKNQGYHCQPKWVRRGISALEDQLLTDLILSRQYAPMGGEDLFFARMSQEPGHLGSVRNPLAKDVAALNKAMATQHGFDPMNFSTTSARSAGISSLCQAGVSEDNLSRFAGHKSSHTTKTHYIFQGALRKRVTSALSLDSGQVYDEDDLLLLMEAMTIARSQLRVAGH